MKILSKSKAQKEEEKGEQFTENAQFQTAAEMF